MTPAPQATDAITGFTRAQDRMLDRYHVDAESRFVDIPMLDGRAHVLVAGDGPPVVMAIGGGMVAAMWAPLMERLDGFTLYAFDPPGHGLSDPATYRTETLRATSVGFLEQLLDGLGLVRPPFIAQSMGGLWSTWFALDRHDRASAIAYIGCPALMLGSSAPLPLRLSTIRLLRRLLTRLDPPSPKQVDRLAAIAGERFTDLPELRDLFVAYEKLPGTPPVLLALHRSLIRVRGARAEVELTATELARVTQPVQLIWGENDPFGSPSLGRQAADIIPSAELHLVGGGHGPWFTRSEAIGPIVTEFLHQQASPATNTRGGRSR